MSVLKKITAFSAAALLSIASLTGCGNDFVGKWEAKSLTTGDQTYEGEINGTPVAVAFQIELKNDGEGEILIAGSENEAITWEADGDKVTAKASGSSEELTFQKDGDTLTAEQGGMNVVLVKVDDFTERPAE